MFAKGINVIMENKYADFISLEGRGLTTKKGSAGQCGEKRPGLEG